jgi:hypothetical protein
MEMAIPPFKGYYIPHFLMELPPLCVPSINLELRIENNGNYTILLAAKSKEI